MRIHSSPGLQFLLTTIAYFGTDGDYDWHDLARAFLDFMMTDSFQAQIPASDHVYPVISGLPMTEWRRWAEMDIDVADMDATQAQIDRWVLEWSEIMAATRRSPQPSTSRPDKPLSTVSAGSSPSTHATDRLMGD